MVRRYYSASDFYKTVFGCKAYKLSLDAGCTCPTRDGTKGSGGCIFCSASGSGDFASLRTLSIPDQVKQAKLLVQHKNRDGVYIAYFQNFTNTYGDPAVLDRKYREALACPGVKGISIATRPDCLNSSILSRIAAIAQTSFVSVELGLQTVKPESVQYIRRGYETEEYRTAVALLHRTCPEIHVVTHVIFGLPGETEDDMMTSVKYCAKCGSDGIKLQLLHVLRGTDLAGCYEAGCFTCMTEEAYFSAVSHALELLPPDMVIHRLTGDGAKKILIAPLWSAQKHTVHNDMEKWFSDHNVIQGSRYGQ